ncbi:MAG: glycosyltransferase, partial [Candidatus Komeilibacteria bacterium]
VFGSRFLNFADINRLKEICDEIKPDFIWTNDMTRVPTYQLISDAKIICYNHWIDNRIMPKISEDKTYIFRQAEGAYKSDLAIVNSKFGIEFFLLGLKDYFTDEIIQEISNKIIPVPPLINMDLTRREEKFTKPTFLFNHRLSSLGYYKDNFDMFVKACNQLDFAFDVILTNPSGYIISDLPKYMKILNFESYNEYLDMVSRCWACVGVFLNSYGTWSMSMTDAIVSNTLVILPNMYGYPEMVPQDYGYKFSNIDELVELLNFATHLPPAVRMSLEDNNIKFAKENYSTTTRFEKLLNFLEG